MAFRGYLPIWVFLVSLFTFSNASTTIIEKHVISTSITVNEHSKELLSAELRLVARDKPSHEDAGKRQVQDPSTTTASGNPAASGLLFLVGTHAVTFTGGEVKSIDGTAFSLDPQSRTLYATGSPYYVPVRPQASSSTLIESSPLPAASNSAQSETAAESRVSQTFSGTQSGESSSTTRPKSTANSPSSVSIPTTGVPQPSQSTSTTSEALQSKSKQSEADTRPSSMTTTGSTNVGSSLSTTVTSESLTGNPQNCERTSRSENAQSSASSSDHVPGTGISIITGSTTTTGIGGFPSFASFTNSSASAKSSSDSANANTPTLGTGAPISLSGSSISSSLTRSDSRGPKSIPSTLGSIDAPVKTSDSMDSGTGGPSVETDSSSNPSDGQEESMTSSISSSGSNSDTRGTHAPSTTPARTSVTSQTGKTLTGEPTSQVAPKEVTLETVEWRQSASLVSCKPPCTLTLPPIPLNTPAVLEYPAITTSICTNVGNVIYTYITTISVSAATISELSLKPLPVSPMSSDQPAVTSAAEAQYPLGFCSMALPAGTNCGDSSLRDSTDGKCGIANGNVTKCPGMQCCSATGQCGTDNGACAKESGCQSDYGACWPDGQQSFLPLSEAFGTATITSDCPIAIRPSLPTAGPIIAGATNQTADVPTATQTSTTGVIPPPIVIPGQTTQGPVPIPVPVPIVPPGIPRLCGACGINMDPFEWHLDIGCSGPLCDTIKPKGGGCHGPFCDIFKCHIGCDGGKGGGGGSKPPPPPEEEDEPDPPEDEDEPTKPTVKPTGTPTRPSGTPVTEEPTKSSSESECETTMTATDVTAFCNVVTQFGNFGNTSSFAAPQTTCTSTKKRVTEGCTVKATTTSVFDSCSKTQTATDITKYCTESVSGGVTYTPCTKTASTVFEGCSVTATTTSVVDEACQAMVTLAPDDPQGEFGSLPNNDTCPFYPGVEISPLDDQGQDGQKDNDTCPLFNGTRPTIDDDQGDDDSKGCKAKNGTASGSGSGGSCPASMANLVQGPDGAEDGSESCPMNNTITYEPEGDLEGDEASSCNASMSTMNVTLDMELSQGEDGVAPESCSLNSTLEVDNLQGEDGPSGSGCPVPPEGMIISPLADQGDYAAMNDSCPMLDPRYPISPMDEQGDDPRPKVNACPIPNITIEELPDDPPEQSSTGSTSSTMNSEALSILLSIWSPLTSAKTSTSSTGCARPASRTGLGPCSLVIPKSLLTASATGSKASKTLMVVQKTEVSDGPKQLVSTGQSKRLGEAPKTKSGQLTEGQGVALQGPEEVDLGKSKIRAEASSAQSGALQGRDAGQSNFPWSCACESTGFITTIEATTICGQAMCPNWVSLTPLSEESVSHPPDLPTLPPVTKTSEESSAPPPVITSEYTPCQCHVPRDKDLGSCSGIPSFTIAEIGDFLTKMEGDVPESCACDVAGGEQTTVAPWTTCGQTVCPNQVEETTLSVPDDCPQSACVPPLTSDYGLCYLNSHEFTSKGEPKTGWECACDGQPSTLVNVQTGCHGRPVCPNQNEIVSAIPTWRDIVPMSYELDCWTALPSLLYFGLCKQSAMMGSVAPFAAGVDACFCDVAGDPDGSVSFEASRTGCGGKPLCPNSEPFPAVLDISIRDVRIQGSTTATATAVRPVIPVVTDATPGSVPMAMSEPTKAAAGWT